MKGQFDMNSDEGFDGSTMNHNESALDEPVEPPPEELVRTDQVTGPKDDPSSWTRRTFFKSAALGTAAAALYEGGRAVFSPLVAYADDLSQLPCTAQDVRIAGPGVVLNEECICTGTFTAIVAFPVENTTGTERYCVALHLVPTGGVTLPSYDFILINPDTGDSTLPRNTTTTMLARIENYPCGLGTVCFGQPGTTRGKCDPGTCSTVAWNTSPNAAGCATPDQTPPAGQCRHQQICIQGRGVTTLDCDVVATGVQEVCAIECGADTVVQLCTTSDASFGPFTFVLSVPGQPDQTHTGATGEERCHNFTVSGITADTTITGTVTDRTGCARSDTITLTTEDLTAEIIVSGGATCGLGNLTFTASVPGRTGCSFVWSIDGEVVPDVTGDTLMYPANADTECHTISVVASCGGCDASASTSVTQCVTTAACTPTP